MNPHLMKVLYLFDMKYTQEDLQKAYTDWQDAPKDQREDLWFKYCDIRDGLSLGTHKANDGEKKRKHVEQYIYQ